MTDTVRCNFMGNGMESFELQLISVNSFFFGLNPVSPPIQDRLYTPNSKEPLGFG